VGQGSTFRVHLPASDQRPESATIRAPALRCGRGRILVMDDNRQVRELAVRMLEKAGYEVTPTESGGDAQAAYREALAQGKPFAAVLLDLTVPGGEGGKDTMQELLAVDPAARGIVVSGYSDDPVLAHHHAYGFVAGLAKPYHLEELLDVVARVTGSDE
jgi:DNA-binding NtrC family response regulator